jgi:hypothetical protein
MSKKPTKKVKKFTPANPAEADLLRGVGLSFDVVVDSMQKELIKLVKELQ